MNGKDIAEETRKAIQKSRPHLKLQEVRPYLRQHYFKLRNNTFLEAKQRLLSFVFVREPFERLVSSYYDKMDRDWSNPSQDERFTRMRNAIIKRLSE